MGSDAKLLDNFMEKSHMWYSMAAEKGHVPRKVGNAKMYLEDPTRDNVKLAMQIYEEADQAGNVDATYNLGFVGIDIMMNSYWFLSFPSSLSLSHPDLL